MTTARKLYPSDLTDLQWHNISHLFPGEDRRPGGPGRPRTYDLREVVNAVLYLARGGCTWRMLPHDFPPWKTVSYYFYTWRDAGVWERVHAALRAEVRGLAGRGPTPSAGILDSQTVKTTEAGGPKGYDGGEKVAGRKRHILVDTLGLIWGLAVLPAHVQDRDGAEEVIKRVGKTLPRLARVWADAGYKAFAGWVAEHCRWVLDIVLKRPGQTTFEVQKWQWDVERTFGWFGRYRRLSKDYEHRPASSEAWVYVAMIHRMSRHDLPEKNKDDDLLRRPPKRPNPGFLEAGAYCKRFLDDLRGQPAGDVQADELWAFVGCKEKTRLRLGRGQECGDVWCFLAIERNTKMILAHHVGKRTPDDALEFAEKLRRATRPARFQLSTDGFTPYPGAVDTVFGPNIDYGQIVKVFGPTAEQGTAGRYSPGQILSVDKTAVIGNPDQDRICTSHCERQNKTLRMQIRRYTRLTDGHSKKWENHEASVALYLAYFNYCRVHSKIKTTPAKKAGVTDHVWSVAELLQTVGVPN